MRYSERRKKSRQDECAEKKEASKRDSSDQTREGARGGCGCLLSAGGGTLGFWGKAKGAVGRALTAQSRPTSVFLAASAISYWLLPSSSFPPKRRGIPEKVEPRSISCIEHGQDWPDYRLSPTASAVPIHPLHHACRIEDCVPSCACHPEDLSCLPWLPPRPHNNSVPEDPPLHANHRLPRSGLF